MPDDSLLCMLGRMDQKLNNFEKSLSEKFESMEGRLSKMDDRLKVVESSVTADKIRWQTVALMTGLLASLAAGVDWVWTHLSEIIRLAPR